MAGRCIDAGNWSHRAAVSDASPHGSPVVSLPPRRRGASLVRWPRYWRRLPARTDPVAGRRGPRPARRPRWSRRCRPARARLPLELRVSGVVRAQNQVEIRPEIAAVLAEVLVRSGDAVDKGQPLVRLEPDPQRQDLRQGQASVRLAQAEAAAARARVTELEAQASRTRKLAEQAHRQRARARDPGGAARRRPRPASSRRWRGVEEARASVGVRRSTLDKTVCARPSPGGSAGARPRWACWSRPPPCCSWSAISTR